MSESEVPEVVKEMVERGVGIVVDATTEEIMAWLRATNPGVLESARKDIIIAKQGLLLQEHLEGKASGADTPDKEAEE